MNTNSNSYTIIYAAVMVVIVAFLLAFVSSSLKSIQNANIENDTKKQILSAINVTDVKDADAEFAKYEVKDMLVQADGTLAAYLANSASASFTSFTLIAERICFLVSFSIFAFWILFNEEETNASKNATITTITAA